MQKLKAGVPLGTNVLTEGAEKKRKRCQSEKKKSASFLFFSLFFTMSYKKRFVCDGTPALN